MEKIKIDQCFANLVLSIFANTARAINIPNCIGMKDGSISFKRWLREIIKWTDEDNIYFQTLFEYDLCDVDKIRRRIKELAIKKLEGYELLLLRKIK